MNNGLFFNQSPYNMIACTVSLFNLLLYSLITLPEVLNVHSDETDVAGTARMDLANFDNWGYLVRALLFHQVRIVEFSSVPNNSHSD